MLMVFYSQIEWILALQRTKRNWIVFVELQVLHWEDFFNILHIHGVGGRPMSHFELRLKNHSVIASLYPSS